MSRPPRGCSSGPISPGPAAFTAVLASEHLHDVLFVGAFGLALVALERRWVAWLGVGVLLGLVAVRPPDRPRARPRVRAPALSGRRSPRDELPRPPSPWSSRSGSSSRPSVAWQYQRYGRVSLSTSNFDGWNLLVGLNVKSGGQYSRDDLALVNAAPEHRRVPRPLLPPRHRTPDPASRARSSPSPSPKFETMWGDSTYGATWTLGSQPAGASESGRHVGPPEPGRIYRHRRAGGRLAVDPSPTVVITRPAWPSSASRPSPCRRPFWRSSRGITPSSSRSCASSPGRPSRGSRSGYGDRRTRHRRPCRPRAPAAPTPLPPADVRSGFVRVR